MKSDLDSILRTYICDEAYEAADRLICRTSPDPLRKASGKPGSLLSSAITCIAQFLRFIRLKRMNRMVIPARDIGIT